MRESSERHEGDDEDPRQEHEAMGMENGRAGDGGTGSGVRPPDDGTMGNGTPAAGEREHARGGNRRVGGEDRAPIRVVVVDDEAAGREMLRRLLAAEGDVELVGEFANGLEAVAAISRARHRGPGEDVELAFLDVRMPELDGLGVLECLGSTAVPEIVFMTAYDSQMERALQVHAVDYLRKPYPVAHFRHALDEARRRVRARRALAGQLRAVRAGDPGAPTRAASGAPAGPAPGASQSVAAGKGEPGRSYGGLLRAVQAARHDSRIAVHDRRQRTWDLIERDDVVVVEADAEGQVRVQVRGKTYFWRKTLQEVQDMLDPGVFLRVHRSVIVNSRWIRRVKALEKAGEFTLVMADGRLVDTGRTYRHVVEGLIRALGDRPG